jgi:hypothetical protein
MGEFKPMVKMETTEPSVILKLKKGGSAHKKMMGGGMMKHGGSSDHKPMQGKMNGGVMGALSGATPVIRGTTAAPVARMPMRPSMASRRKAMMAKAPMMPKKMMAKDGGKACKDGGDVEKDLKAHASKPASKAHAGLKKGGMACKTGGVALGNGGGYKKGGMAKHKMNMGGTAYKKGGMACATGGVTLGNGGGYKKGGKACATGGVALGNAGGYKKGGASKKAYANGGSVNDEGKAVSMPQGNKKPSSPVSISKLSGTFKKGGNVSSKKLQNVFMNENATAMKESKAKLLDKYSPYQKADGGPASDKEYAAVIKKVNEKNERAYGKKMDILKGQGNVTEKEREIIRKYAPKYPSGMTDTDIDKVISSKEVQEGMSSFEDKKRGGKVGK